MERLAAQLFTVRDFCKTAKDFSKTLKRIKAMGYEGVQLSGIGPIPAKEIQKILNGEGLSCVATHTDMERVFTEPEKVAEENLLWGCKHPAIGGFFPQKNSLKLKTWKDFVVKFNKAAQVMGEMGAPLGYHNHFHEFIKLPDGLTCYDHLMRELDPSCTWFEVDTFWVAAGGKEPSTLLRKLAHKVPCLHLKDGKMVVREGKWGPDLKITEVGDGNLEWPEIIAAAKFAGVQWYIVERDNGELEPFASLERSFHNLRGRMGL